MRLKKWFIVAWLAFFSHGVLAITNADLFTWAADAYAAYFPGTHASGQYQQYDYRAYSSGNYLAVDNAGGVFVLGPVSGGAILQVGTLPGFAPAVQAWQAAQPRGRVLIEAWNPDGSKASIYDFVNATHYVINRWSMYSNYGIFPMGAAPATAQIGSDISLANVQGVDYIAMDAPGGRPFYFTALWKAPAIGTVFMRLGAPSNFKGSIRSWRAFSELACWTSSTSKRGGRDPVWQCGR
ncbi:MAG: hypothetical protein V4787_24625 [Pseudomonadota bacterium]